MEKYKLSYEDFLTILEKETNLLADLCIQFDKGNYDYANVISTKITSIINFKGKKESILTNMEKQEKMSFCATSKVLEKFDDILFYRSLVTQVIKDNKIIYCPKFDSGKYPTTWKPFDTWANAPVYIINLDRDAVMDGLIYVHEINESTQNIITRRDLLNFYRNKFVGAHSDLKLEASMYRMATYLSSIEHLDHPDTTYQAGEKYKPGVPIKYMLEMAVRQIAHEIILSIKRAFSFQVKYQPSIDFYLDNKPKNSVDMLFRVIKENGDGTKEVETKMI